MAYFLDLFTPETWHAFREMGATITGFRDRQRGVAFDHVCPGDIFLCYVTRISRWSGVLQVDSAAYHDDSPIHEDFTPFTIRFRVKPIVVLDFKRSIPIYDDEVWKTLTITKQHEKGIRGWTGFFRSSLNRFDEEDGKYLEKLLKSQKEDRNNYPLTDKENRRLAQRRKVPTPSGEVEVEVPDDDEDNSSPETDLMESVPTLNARESIQVQSRVAQIGAEMGFSIWVPKSDKTRVLEHVPQSMHGKFLNILPLNYDDTTLRTVEQIDVLWLKGRSMARAFEIEHTTAIYSGLLRMADLLALQPNMDIRLHIVAPPDKREKVLREIRRPVFSLLERGPLYDQCSFLSYDSIDILAKTPHLAHMSDSIIKEYEETAEV